MSGIHDCPDCDCEPSPCEPMDLERIRERSACRYGDHHDCPEGRRIRCDVRRLCDALDKTRRDADDAVKAAAREINELRDENEKLLRKVARLTKARAT